MPEQPPYKWLVPKLLNELKAAYADGLPKRYWEQERETLASRLKALSNKLSGRYSNPELAGLGGSGVVLKLRDEDLAQQPVALKFPRPVAGQDDILKSLVRSEIGHLATLHHTSVVRIHGRGTGVQTTGSVAAFPFYLMDFVDGASSGKYFDNPSLPQETVIEIVERIADAIRYLHAAGVAHLDIKADNILIRHDSIPVIADLGTTKRLRTDSDETDETIVACTQGYADPKLLELIDEDPSDPNRSKGTLRYEQIDRLWDLYPFGLTLLEWLGLSKSGERSSRLRHLPIYTRKYLLLMAARCLRGRVPPWLEEVVGLDRRLLGELGYGSFDSVLEDVRKLSGKFSLVDAVPELNTYHPGTIQVAADSPTTYSKRLAKVLEHPALRRLAAIPQLGLVSQVYPTATHSRFEHSLGTYHNTCRFVLSLYYDPLSPLFRQVVGAPDIEAVLVAALLHDIGQFPLAHDLEEIDGTVFDHKRLTRRQLEPPDTPTLPFDRQSLDIALRDWHVTAQRVVEILSARADQQDLPIKDRLLHSVIDGPIDADKLDYLRRDSDRLRVPYGSAIDTERILRCLTVVVSSRGLGPTCVGVHEKAKVAAEFVAIARYALFSQAYWHHTVRSMKAMLSRAVWRLITSQEWHDKWHQEFESFVLALPTNLYLASPEQSSEMAQSDDNLGSTHPEWLSFVRSSNSTMAATDAAVLGFIRNLLGSTHAAEAGLLDDLLDRRTYKRLFVFSRERSPGDWLVFQAAWDRLVPTARLKVYETLERDVANAVSRFLEDGQTTSVVTAESKDKVWSRINAQAPLLLIDLPSRRPGSDTGLHYVLEAQRRALRKDERSVGDAHSSQVWDEFGKDLRDRAGKVRVFCHPALLDCIEACVDRPRFVRMFEQAANRWG